MIFLFASLALAEGFSANTFSPALDNKSGLMWETPQTINARAVMLSYTLQYAFRPLEFGDGKSERVSVLDHLQSHHLGISYGLSSRWDAGLEVPIVFYANTKNPEGIFFKVGSERKFFFLADGRMRTKFQLLEGDFKLATLLSAGLPIGSTDMLLSDDAVKFTFEVPLSLRFGRFTVFFFSWVFSLQHSS